MKLRATAGSALIVIAGSAGAQTVPNLPANYVPLITGGGSAPCTIIDPGITSGPTTIGSGTGSPVIIIGNGTFGGSGGGNYTVSSGTGNDTVYAGTGSNTVMSGTGSNVINLGQGGPVDSNGNPIVVPVTTTTTGTTPPTTTCVTGSGGATTIGGGTSNDTIPAGGYSAGTGQFSASEDESPVPEPASWVMMAGGLGLVGGAMRRRKRGVAVDAG